MTALLSSSDALVPVAMPITHVTRDTPDIFSLKLDPPSTYFRFEPGQFNMLYVFGRGEAAISICGDPAKPRELRHTIRAVGNVTRALQLMRRGDQIGVRGPFGHPWPIESAQGKDVLIIAGGIGLAPLKPVIHHVLRHRKQYGHIAVLYGTRSPADILYRRTLNQWSHRADLDFRITVDRAGPDWRGHVGVVTDLIPRTVFDPDNVAAFVCGPEVMIRFTTRQLTRSGVSLSSIWISMERHMQCGIGTCGHCQFGPKLVCRDGPVFRFDDIRSLIEVWEI